MSYCVLWGHWIGHRKWSVVCHCTFWLIRTTSPRARGQTYWTGGQGPPCDVPLPLWWRSIKRAALGFSAAAALVMKSWHTTARAHTLKRWKATISFLLRMFQEVKALRCFLQGSRSETQKLVSWSGPSWGPRSFSNWIFYIWMIWVVPELSNGWSAHSFEAIFTQN